MSNRQATRPRVSNLVQFFESASRMSDAEPQVTANRRKNAIAKNRSRAIVRTVEELEKPKTVGEVNEGNRRRSNGVYRARGKSTAHNEISKPLPLQRGTSSKPRTALEQVLRMPVLRDGLLEFSKKEFSDESVLLLISIHEYKNSTGVDRRKKQAQQMYQTYIAHNSDREVNLDSSMRERLHHRLLGHDSDCYIAYAGIDIFEEIETAVGVAVGDIFMRYTTSPLFKTL
jgi:hypothetical protein